MTIVLDQRPDASLAVYIDGDLQFDSRDEALYHEALVLPALALAEQRQPQRPLRVLICGGGDGLAAREVLRSPRVARLDLVDYDSTILCLARDEWGAYNARSLHDLRTFVHVRDAWVWVQDAITANLRYDLIICDFTVPRDVEGARLHTIEWYTLLRQVLAPTGVLAANAVSPSQTPAAYWSIYNALRTANLYPRPYRIALPSFTDHGYGDDWGFVVGAVRPLQAAEFTTLRLPEPTQFLYSTTYVQRMFSFPQALADARATARPTRPGSEWLTQALFNPTWQSAAGHDWDALTWTVDSAPLPAPDSGSVLIPHALHGSLAQPAARSVDEQALFTSMLDLMPALRPDQTRSMVRKFLDQPARFLRAIDLRALVDALLRRAAALPKRLVVELRYLRAHLRRTWNNSHQLLHLGLRIVSIIAIVVMLSNLFHPDTAYGKGSTDGGSGVSSGSLARSAGPYDVVAAPPSTVSGGGYRSSSYGRGYTVDETGTTYSPRRYRYSRSYYGGSSYRSYNRNSVADPVEEESLYRLTPETDLLANGEVVIALTDQSYLLLADQVTSIVETSSGLPIIFLKRDPALIWRTNKELQRQKAGLATSVKEKQDWLNWLGWMGFAPWRESDEAELANMRNTVDVVNNAITSLGEIPGTQPPIPEPPTPAGFQLWTGVWIDNTGTQAIIERPDGGQAFLNRDGWWRDAAHTQPIDDSYPDDFRRIVLVPWLKQQTNEYAAVTQRLQADLTSAKSDLTSLQKDKTEYESIQKKYGPSDEVEYGTSEISVSKALQLTNDDISRTQQLIDILQGQIEQLPELHDAETNLLRELDR